MMKPLRKRHLQIWTAWAVLLPVGIIMAWISVPQSPNNAVLQPAADSKILSQLIQSIQKETYTVNIRCSEKDSICQVEYINRLPLNVPSALLYEIKPGSKSVSQNNLLGRIEAKGTYYFSLPYAAKNNKPDFLLYDFIHRQIIDTIKFSK